MDGRYSNIDGQACLDCHREVCGDPTSTKGTPLVGSSTRPKSTSLGYCSRVTIAYFVIPFLAEMKSGSTPLTQVSWPVYVSLHPGLNAAHSSLIVSLR
jgi:hypothetical protein